MLSRAPDQGLGTHPQYQPLGAPRADGQALATVPRYEAFTAHARWLAAQGVDFVEIAGNRGEIVLSLLAPDAWRPASGRVLFEQPVLTRPGTRRVVPALPVPKLAAELRREAADPAPLAVEHIYDY